MPAAVHTRCCRVCQTLLHSIINIHTCAGRLLCPSSAAVTKKENCHVVEGGLSRVSSVFFDNLFLAPTLLASRLLLLRLASRPADHISTSISSSTQQQLSFSARHCYSTTSPQTQPYLPMEDLTALFHQYETDYCNKSTDISRKISSIASITGGV